MAVELFNRYRNILKKNGYLTTNSGIEYADLEPAVNALIKHIIDSAPTGTGCTEGRNKNYKWIQIGCKPDEVPVEE